jgi:hypothetical protein
MSRFSHDLDFVILWLDFGRAPFCVWVAIMTQRRASPDNRRGALVRSFLLFLAPLGIYAILAAGFASLSVDGQWTWLGETMKVSLAQDFANNLFIFGVMTFPFPVGYGVLGLAVWCLTAWTLRNTRPQNPTRGNPDMPF